MLRLLGTTAVLAVMSACVWWSFEQGRADQLVGELREFPASLPATRSDGTLDPVEERRRNVYAQLQELGEAALPALARGLADPDVRLRRGVAMFLNAAGGGLLDSAEARLDIKPCVPALTLALRDPDARVRGLAAQAIGHVGAPAASAVPELLQLLQDTDEGVRNSACIGLAGIGPAARDGLPALRKALSDPSADVRRFAGRAIAMIEEQR